MKRKTRTIEMQRPEEKDIIEEIRNNSNYKAFEKLFKANQPVLVIFAHKFVGDWEVARDLVQEVFRISGKTEIKLLSKPLYGHTFMQLLKTNVPII